MCVCYGVYFLMAWVRVWEMCVEMCVLLQVCYGVCISSRCVCVYFFIV